MICKRKKIGIFKINAISQKMTFMSFKQSGTLNAVNDLNAFFFTFSLHFMHTLNAVMIT